MKRGLSKTEYVRLEAIKAASTALQNDRFGTVDVWALATFYVEFVTHGPDGTRKQFGPPKRPKGKLLKLVRASPL